MRLESQNCTSFSRLDVQNRRRLKSACLTPCGCREPAKTGIITGLFTTPRQSQMAIDAVYRPDWTCSIRMAIPHCGSFMCSIAFRSSTILILLPSDFCVVISNDKYPFESGRGGVRSVYSCMLISSPRGSVFGFPSGVV